MSFTSLYAFEPSFAILGKPTYVSDNLDAKLFLGVLFSSLEVRVVIEKMLLFSVISVDSYCMLENMRIS